MIDIMHVGFQFVLLKLDAESTCFPLFSVIFPDPLQNKRFEESFYRHSSERTMGYYENILKTGCWLSTVLD